MMGGYPRLHVEESEPPAPLPFVGRAVPGRGASGRGGRGLDAGSGVEEALARAERALESLNAMNDEMLSAIPFPRGGDDEGPRAA